MGTVRVRPFRGYNSAQATLWLSARFLINSPSPTFSIFLAFILCTPCILIFSLVSMLVYLVHHLVHLVFTCILTCIYLLYLSFSILRYLCIFSYLFSPLSCPCQTPTLPHSPLSHRSLTL